MSKHSKLSKRLDSLEEELKVLLVPTLRATAAGKDDSLFLTSETNPHPELRQHVSLQGQALLSTAQEISRLAAQLGKPTEYLLATKVHRYFSQAHDLKDHHRGSPAGMAARFLDELGEKR